MAGEIRQIEVVNSYKVYIGYGILSMVGEKAAECAKSRKALIVTDDNIPDKYINKVEASLRDNGFEAVKFVFPHGEKSKCAATYLELVNFAAKERLCRSDVMIALGGGVTGDLTGFAAATYMRGIKYIQVPTSLLAAVDSSVGGKTAIDLESGKNLVGAFYRPSAVICDLETLSTLSDDFVRDGMAEVIKYAHIREKELYSLLEGSDGIYDAIKKGAPDARVLDIVYRCVKLKADIVNADEFESGERALLNLGHTVGHAIEAANDFNISHGHAVAMGMCIVANAAVKCGMCDQSVYDGIASLNQKYRLPTRCDNDADTLYNGALSDKKNTGSGIKVIVPDQKSSCVIRKMTHEELYGFIKKGLEI